MVFDCKRTVGIDLEQRHSGVFVLNQFNFIIEIGAALFIGFTDFFGAALKLCLLVADIKAFKQSGTHKQQHNNIYNQYKKDNCKQFSLEAPVIPATQTYIQPFAR